MQPQYSPDGRFWWDGREWQPVSPPDPPPTPPKKRKTPLIIAGVIILALIIIGVPATYLIIRNTGTNTESSGGPPPSAAEGDPPTGIEPGDEITEETLQQVSAESFYWELLHRQMTQPISVIADGYFDDPSVFEKHDFYYVARVGVDHASGQSVDDKVFTFENGWYKKGKPDDMARCVDGKHYRQWEDYDTGKDEWRHAESGDDDCQSFVRGVISHTTDGIVASGLTSEQADQVISTLRGDYQFGEPQQPTLITGNDKKTYIRQIVEYRPVKVRQIYWGTKIFSWAFEATGLDPETWPWYTGFGPGEGLHAVYYLDTETLLPSVLVKRSTPVLDEDGKVREVYNQTSVYNYEFPEKLTQPTLKDMNPIKLTLPEGWTIPE